MNEQLNLISFADLGIAQSAKPSNKKQRSINGRDSSMSEWWKLSNEERQQGLAGVRAIRAILKKSAENHTLEMRKAS